MKEKLTYAFYLLLPIIGGSLVGLLINNSIDYNSLVKPPFSPPSITFPIAWTIIYILLGIAFFLYKKEGSNEKTDVIYYTQLILF